ncbi:MAG: hypothetical protein C4520_10600 [Candidatus Abyssobacteria bacterium SURF_5]|uniref:Uncharacterized protein n=1 Tax=Abyssobacteria bacterium (strain SURF_5) TaxID=2093360 RepID=A0A3A4NPN0_ABYX5|nr:MAG: hypothetical protein C4520_10600 [Candidatus Abyssubacteria bacterium SURF_5]
MEYYVVMNYQRIYSKLLPILLMIVCFGCASAKPAPCDARRNYCPSANLAVKDEPVLAEQAQDQEFGIEVVSVRLTAENHLIDFRYRVLDPEKASDIFDRQNPAYLVDEASGDRLTVPRMAKVGPLRQTNFNPDAKRVYFILFSNTGGIIHPGSLVSLEAGNCRINHLIVE